MNAGTIIKIEYRIDGDTAYTSLAYTGFTAEYVTTVTQSAPGTSYQLQIQLKIPMIQKTVSETLSSLAGRKLNIRFTDGNGRVYTAGNSSYPARLQYRERISGTAGGWNGYEVTITRQSPDPHVVADS